MLNLIFRIFCRSLGVFLLFVGISDILMKNYGDGVLFISLSALNFYTAHYNYK